MAKAFTEEDAGLLAELGVDDEPAAAGQPARVERILAGFEDILRFADAHGRAPRQGVGRDIFERLYAVRLEAIAASPEARALCEPHDRHALLAGAFSTAAAALEALDDDALLAELDAGEDAPPRGDVDVTELRHVRSAHEKRLDEGIGRRDACADFTKFRPLFDQVQRDLAAGVRQTRRYEQDAEIRLHDWFVLGGQKAYVAEMGEPFETPDGRPNARLRVIFDNATQSRYLLRSLQRALYKDEAGRRISEPEAGPLFADRAEDGDAASGTVYVLRSKSDHPVVAAHRDVLHKIGVTGGDVARRIANARLEPTFLMADVEIVATYELFNIKRSRLEALIHRIFDPARLAIEVTDRFGQQVAPREWFLAPLFVIREAMDKIRNGTITDYVYDVNTARLALADGATRPGPTDQSSGSS